MAALSTAARNAAVDAVVDLIDGGSGAGLMRIRASTTVLATITLDDPAFGASATGTATGAGFPKSDSSADATGTPDNYQITDSDVTVVISGTAAVGSSEVNCDGNITAGQTVTVNSLTYTQPAGT